MRKFTLLIVPRLGGRIREFRLSILMVAIILLAVVFGYVSLYLTAQGIRPFLADKAELENLREENDRLEERVIDMTRKILLIKKHIQEITAKEAEIRKLADIIDETPRAKAETNALKSAEPPLKAISDELSGLKQLSSYYDSLVNRINLETGLIDRIPTVRPICNEAYVSARFGMKTDPFSGKIKPHQGVDFAYTEGTPVVAAAAGTVLSAGHEKGFGNTVRIAHGMGFVTMYAHLKDISVVPGRPVDKGQKVGTLGNSGRSIGPHLHYEVIKDGKPVNPEDYF